MPRNSPPAGYSTRSPSPRRPFALGAAQAELGGGQRLQARRLDRLTAAQALAVAALGQPQLGQADLAHAGPGLGQQGFQHLVVLSLQGLFGEIR